MYIKTRDALAGHGIKAYAPGQHRGDCVEPYVVIKDFGQNEIVGTALNRNIIDVIIYAPIARYSQIEGFTQSVKVALREVKELKDTRYRSPVLVDNDKNAYTTSMRYERYLANKS